VSRSLLVAGITAVVVAAVASPPASAAGAAQRQNRPIFAVLHHPRALTPAITAPSLPNWTFTYTYASQTYGEDFLGGNPSGDGSTTIPVEIVPVKLTFIAAGGAKTIANPLQKLPKSTTTLVHNTVISPIFQSGVDFVQGGTDVGKTQYLDAVQRASLWGVVATHPGYHVLLGQPTIAALKSFTVPTAYGTTGKPFGTKVIEANINWFDATVVQPILAKLPTNVLPVFMITQTYLLQGMHTGCCIGGYHSYTGSTPYAVFSYIKQSGKFSQDVSALSHEIGETINDPMIDNAAPPACSGIYEVGDPLENEPHYGDYPYALGGFTYHLQDLAMPPYFGAPTGASVNGWSSFQGTPLAVCQNG